MVTGSLALLNHFFYCFLHSYFKGSRAAAPVGGQSPVEWGEIPSVRLSRFYVWRGYEALQEGPEGKPEGLGSSWKGL